MMRKSRHGSILDAYQLIIAGVLFASPWLFAFVQPTAITDIRISAVLVAALSVAALFIFREWEAWINAILGVWIAASPWILGFQHTKAAHVMLGVGLLIGYLAILELWLIHYGDDTAHAGDPQQPT